MGENSPYVFVDVSTLWAIHVAVWVRAELYPHISHVLTGTEATGIGGVMGNKGGAGLAFVYRESTTFLFISSHLAARATRLTQRGANYSEICRNIHLNTTPEAKRTQLLHGAHHAFWMGDLNYRIDMGNHGTKEEFTKVSSLIEEGKFEELSKYDQLKLEVENGRIFSGFMVCVMDVARCAGIGMITFILCVCGFPGGPHSLSPYLPHVEGLPWV